MPSFFLMTSSSLVRLPSFLPILSFSSKVSPLFSFLYDSHISKTNVCSLQETWESAHRKIKRIKSGPHCMEMI